MIDASLILAVSELVEDSSDDKSRDSSSNDDEEFLFEEREVPKNERFFEVIDSFDDQLFFEHFRVSRPVADKVAAEFKASPLFNLETGGNGKLTPMQQLKAVVSDKVKATNDQLSVLEDLVRQAPKKETENISTKKGSSKEENIFQTTVEQYNHTKKIETDALDKLESLTCK